MKKWLLIVALLSSPGAVAEGLSFGIGAGIPYGILGTNLTVPVSDTLEVMAGVGWGFGGGFRYRPLASNNNVRITAYYGTNALISEVGGMGFGWSVDKFDGFNLGIGYGLVNGWDIDFILAIVSPEFAKRRLELEAEGRTFSGEKGSYKFTFSWGYHW